MELMQLRRRLMMGMAQSNSYESIIITDSSLTNSSNIDTYFANLIDGWETELIFIVLKNPVAIANRFYACFSKYANDNNSRSNGFTQVYKLLSNGSVQAISRNDWGINVAIGDEYMIFRFGTLPIE